MIVQATSDFMNCGSDNFHLVSCDAPLAMTEEILRDLNDWPLMGEFFEARDVYFHFAKFTPDNKCTGFLKYDVRSPQAVRLLKGFLKFCIEHRMKLWMFTGDQDVYRLGINDLIGKLAGGKEQRVIQQTDPHNRCKQDTSSTGQVDLKTPGDTIACPSCGRLLRLPRELGGKTGVCKACRHRFHIPS